MGEGGTIPEKLIILVSGDLQAQVRLDAAVRPLGFLTDVRRPDGELGDARPFAMVLDLDRLGSEGAARWVGQAADGVRILGFYSHIDRELGDAAARLGVEIFRRGRFWRQLPEELGDA